MNFDDRQVLSFTADYFRLLVKAHAIKTSRVHSSILDFGICFNPNSTSHAMRTGLEEH